MQQQRVTVPFLGPTAPARSMEVNDQLTLNLTTVVSGGGGKQGVTLEPVPGLVRHADGVGNGPCRTPQMYNWPHPVDGSIELYGVFGSQLVRIFANGSTSVIGTLLTTAGTCRIARGRTHLMVVDGTAGYTYDGTTFAQIADADFPDAGSTPAASPTHVAYIDGFFAINDANSDAYYLSALEDPTSWNALDFDNAAVAPDRALAVIATESTLWVLGDETCEAYYNSGNAAFPFEINLSATQQVGIAAGQAVASLDGVIRFLATTPQGGLFIWEINGLQGRKISTDEIENALSIRDISNAYAFAYTQGGRGFWVLQTAPDEPTLVFNVQAQAWETRDLLGGEAYRLAGHGIIGQTNYAGSRLANVVYRLDLDSYQDDGGELLRLRRTQIHHQNDHLIDWWEIVVDGEKGSTTDPTADPIVRLRYSDDGGNVWSDYLEEPLGRAGEREARAVFRNLGSSRRRIYEVSYTGDQFISLYAAYARVSLNWD